VGPVGPVEPCGPIGPSIPSKLTLYTTDEVKTPLIFWMFEILITPVLVLYALTVPSNELACVIDETTMTEFPGI
jgi:hypothetical protein